MVADKGKKMKAGEKSGEEEAVQVDEALVLSIEKLQEVQDELEKINEEASEKVLDVEQKYNLLRKPVYEKRKDIIQTIPDFWSTAILAHPALGTLVTEEDHKILKYLTSLEVEDSTDVKSGYSITFNFKSNPFFEDEKLTKTFTFHDDEGTTEISATPIKWKEGMPNGVAHEKKGNKRPLDEDSFFGWFSISKQKGTLDEMQDEVAEIIKEDLWPNPLAYFNNDDADEEDLDVEEGDEGDKDGDDSEEDDEEQDDDDEDEEGEGDDEGN